MSTIKSVLMSGVTVITDIVSANVLAQILLLTTQHDLVVVLALECIILMQFLDSFLTKLFAVNDTLSDNIEHVILRVISVVRIAFVFVLVRIGMGVITETFETSQIRWHEIVNIVFISFTFIFILIERSSAPPTAAAAAEGANTAPKKQV